MGGTQIKRRRIGLEIPKYNVECGWEEFLSLVFKKSGSEKLISISTVFYFM